MQSKITRDGGCQHQCPRVHPSPTTYTSNPEPETQTRKTRNKTRKTLEKTNCIVQQPGALTFLKLNFSTPWTSTYTHRCDLDPPPPSSFYIIFPYGSIMGLSVFILHSSSTQGFLVTNDPLWHHYTSFAHPSPWFTVPSTTWDFR